MKRMFMLTLSILTLSLLLAGGSNAQRRNVDKADPPRVSIDALMNAKLESAQALVKGLALEDFESIQSKSQRLELLSMDAGWNVIQTKDYARISKEFREAARHMKKAADEKNLDKVALGYMKMTMSCIDCHRHVRKTRVARR